MQMCPYCGTILNGFYTEELREELRCHRCDHSINMPIKGNWIMTLIDDSFESTGHLRKNHSISVYRTSEGKIQIVQNKDESYFYSAEIVPQIYVDSYKGKGKLFVSTKCDSRGPDGIILEITKVELRKDLWMKCDGALRSAHRGDPLRYDKKRRCEYQTLRLDCICNIELAEKRMQALQSYMGEPTYCKPAKSGGCYVATAVYGSYDCPQVWTLRRFRDNNLAKTWYGRAFIRCYYAISPTLVKWFGHTAWFKNMWRCKLDRMVSALQKKGIESTPYTDRNW